MASFSLVVKPGGHDLAQFLEFGTLASPTLLESAALSMSPACACSFKNLTLGTFKNLSIGRLDGEVRTSFLESGVVRRISYSDICYGRSMVKYA